MRSSEEIKQELQKQLHLEIVQEIDNGEDSRPHIYKVKENDESWFVKVVEIPGRVVANLSVLSMAEKAAIYQTLKLDQKDPKYNELDMWWRVRKSHEYGKEYILGFYKHEFLRWETKDMLGIDLVLFMTEAECLVDRLEKYSSNNPSKVEDEATIFKIGMDICKALIAMESEGVYHRDIKPGNIYFYNGNYVLGDFGISVSRNQKRSSWTRQFTKSYCSPEQKNNWGSDQRMDIYSLGMVLFELSYPDWAEEYNESICCGKEQLPTIGGSKKFDELNKIIHKACRFRKEDRYANARKMLEALEAAVGYDSNKTEFPEDGDPYSADDSSTQISDIDDEMLWEAGKFWYESSRAEGNRFENFEIDERLMSAAGRKKDTEKLPIHVYDENNSKETLRLEDVISESERHHIYLVGEGGIGKTTALYSIMEEAYKTGKPYSTKIQSIPLFIELSKAPDEYKNVYKEGHSTFIRRCIMIQVKAQMSGTQFQLDRDIFGMEENEVVKPVEQLLNAPDASVQYVLLLDGLNEVSVKRLKETRMSVMEMIIEEINQLKDKRNYPKVKLILTGRSDERVVTEDIVRYHLAGVQDVIGYLQANHIEIAGMEENERLLDTLKNPLFLKLYCQISSKDNIATPGEIFYAFFNEHKKNLGTYTVKSRIEQIEQDLRSMASVSGEKRIDAKMQYFILDFLLPEIGWYMEKNNLYFLDLKVLQTLICGILTGRKENDICGKNGKAVFSEYDSGIGVGMDTEQYAELLLRLGATERESVKLIVDCCISSFGILYKNNSQFGFTHQHIRDYFAAMRIINQMRMALYVKDEKACMKDFNDSLLSDDVARFIGEILGEYHNIPEKKDTVWESTVPQESGKRTMLTDCLDLYRNVFLEDDEINYGVRNLLKIIYEARKTLAACDLSKLDLRFCTLNNIELYDADFTGSLLQKETLFPNGHQGAVRNAVFSPTGEYIISGGDDGCIKMWHTKTKKYIKTIAKYPYRVNNIGFSNDGRYFFAATSKKVDVMDALTFEVQHTFEGAYNAVFSPDSQLMALEFRLRKVQIIELASFSCKGKLGYSLKTVHNGYASFNDICFSPDSKKIAYINQSCVELWSIDNYKKIGTFEDSGMSFSVQFSSDGKYIAWGGVTGIITICGSDPNDLLSERREIGDGSRLHDVLAVRFIMDDTSVIAGDSAGQMVISSVTDTENKDYENFHASIYNITEFCSGENDYLTISCDGGLLYILDMKKEKFFCISGSDTYINDIKYISDNNQIMVVGIHDSKALIIECTTKKCIGYFDNGEAGAIQKIAYSQKANKIAVASITGNVSICNANGFLCEKQYVAGDFLYGLSIVFDEKGRYILSGSIDSSEVIIYDMQTDNIRVIDSPDCKNYSVAFYPDEKHVLTAGFRQCIQIDVENQVENKRFCGYTDPYIETNLFDRLERHIMKKDLENHFAEYFEEHLERRGHIESIVYRGDKQRLYLGTLRGYIEVLEANSNRCLALLKSGKYFINTLAISMDGALFTGICKGDTDKIKIYDSETYECLYVLPKMKGPKRTSIEFANGNQQIFVGDRSGMIEIWERKEQYEAAKENYKNNRNIKTLYDKVSSWFYRKFMGDKDFYDYYLVKTIPFVSGLKFNGARFTNLHPKSTLTESDLSILDSYSAIVK